MIPRASAIPKHGDHLHLGVMMAHIDQLRGLQRRRGGLCTRARGPELLRAKVKVFVELYRKTVSSTVNADLERRVEERTAECASSMKNSNCDRRAHAWNASSHWRSFSRAEMDTIGRADGGVAHDFNNC